MNSDLSLMYLFLLFFLLFMGCALGLKACRLLEKHGKVDALALLLMPLEEGVGARMFIYAVAVLPFYFVVKILKACLLNFGLVDTVRQQVELFTANPHDFGKLLLTFLPLPLLLFGKIYGRFETIRSAQRTSAKRAQGGAG